MYPLHPALVHLPIGLLVGNAIFTALYLWRGVPSYAETAYHCLWMGLLLLLPALASGTWEAVRHLSGPGARGDALGWINGHAAASVAVLLVYWQAWTIRRRNPDVLAQAGARRGYLAWLGAGLLLLLASGWLGGHMVYELQMGA